MNRHQVTAIGAGALLAGAAVIGQTHPDRLVTNEDPWGIQREDRQVPFESRTDSFHIGSTEHHR